MQERWDYIGEGTYNRAYKNADETKVLKIAKWDDVETDTPERSVRIWNQINPHIPPPAALVEYNLSLGWESPFIKGLQSTDKEISHALIDIYNRTGRIIVDATAPKNFITTKTGQVVCIDIGMALELELSEERKASRRLQRAASVVSMDAWQMLKDSYVPFFNECEITYPESVQMVKALLYIRIARPDIFNTSFLKEDSGLVKNLAKAYDVRTKAGNRTPVEEIIIEQADKKLDELRTVSFENIQESCINELDRYINSRGTLNKSGEFSPSLMTRLFRDEELTKQKIGAAIDLRKKIQSARSISEIQEKVNKFSTNTDLTKGTFTQGFLSTIVRVSDILDVAQTDKLQQIPKP